MRLSTFHVFTICLYIVLCEVSLHVLLLIFKINCLSLCYRVVGIFYGVLTRVLCLWFSRTSGILQDKARKYQVAQHSRSNMSYGGERKKQIILLWVLTSG